MTLHLNRVTSLMDGHGRPFCLPSGQQAHGCAGLTIAEAGALLRQIDATLPLYVEARWQVTPEAPVSVDRQVAAKVRRLRQIAALCGRNVVRVEQRHGFPTHYTAKLAR